jgi:threonine/homoserine/homoserine lactone efflux protein
VSIEFLVTSLVVIAVPGTGALYTVAAGLSRGTAASVVAAVGCTLGIVPHIAAAVTGLAAVLHTSALAFDVLKYLGVAYLLYMAWKIWNDRSAFEVRESAPLPAAKVIGTGILLNLLNPKLTIFFVAFLPQFVHPGQPDVIAHMVELSAVFMLLTLVVFVAYGRCAAVLRDRVASSPRMSRWIRQSFAGGFVALALALVVSDGEGADGAVAG